LHLSREDSFVKAMKLTTIMLCGIILLFSPHMLFAYGIGVYTTARGGHEGTGIENTAYGAVFDTRLSRLSKMNLRYQIGYGMQNAHQDIFCSIGWPMSGSSWYRLWIGPQGGVSFRIDDDMPMPLVGPVAGLNFHINEYTTLGIDGGYRMIITFHDSRRITLYRSEPFCGFLVFYRFDES